MILKNPTKRILCFGTNSGKNCYSLCKEQSNNNLLLYCYAKSVNMDKTIVIKVNQVEKLRPLLNFLKSIDYVQSIEYFDKYEDFKQQLDRVNASAASTELSQMTMDDINEEIKAYRNGR